MFEACWCRRVGGQAAAARSSGRRPWTAPLRVAWQPVRSSAVADHPDELVPELLAAGTTA